MLHYLPQQQQQQQQQLLFLYRIVCCCSFIIFIVIFISCCYQNNEFNVVFESTHSFCEEKKENKMTRQPQKVIHQLLIQLAAVPVRTVVYYHYYYCCPVDVVVSNSIKQYGQCMIYLLLNWDCVDGNYSIRICRCCWCCWYRT